MMGEIHYDERNYRNHSEVNKLSNYGLPYMGSKSMIAEWVVEQLPRAAHFYDLFVGGGAVTHAAMAAGRYTDYYINDITESVQLFAAAVRGGYRDEKRWISREDFSALKDTDPYVRLCWSFGNDQKSYMYSKVIEPWKRAYWEAVVFGDFTLFDEIGIGFHGNRDDVRTFIRQNHDFCKKKYIEWWLKQQKYTHAELDALIAESRGKIEKLEEQLRQYLLAGLKSSGLTQSEVGKRLGTQMTGHYFGRSQWAFPTQEYYEMMQAFMPALDKDYNEVVGLRDLWQSLESLESLQSLERLQSLESATAFDRLTITQGDYQAVEIKPDSVIYCDPPYKNTAGYLCEFDHDRFYEWAERQENIFISEYSMPSEFKCIAEHAHLSRLSATAHKSVVERLFIPARHKYYAYTQLSLF